MKVRYPCKMVLSKLKAIFVRPKVMKVALLFVVISSISLGSIFLYKLQSQKQQSVATTTPVIVPYEKYPDLANWKRPDGPIRVGLQVGHWKTDEVPDELVNLKNNGGTSVNGVDEWEVNLSIANEAKKLLEAKGIVVDILPATIPPGYLADAFVSIHVDGSTDYSTTGFKVASPRRDMSGKASQLTQTIYGEMTGLPKDPNITRNMTSYYAFSWRKFDHSLHPMTPATILETGFLTNQSDKRLLTKNASIVPAEALADALLQFLNMT
jgi:hypothetical protein